MLTNIPFYNRLLGKMLFPGKYAQNSHVLVYGAVTAHDFGEKGCIASNERIAQECGLTKNTVAKCLSELSKALWITVIMDNGTRKKIEPSFEINFPEVNPLLPTGKPPFTSSTTPLYLQVNREDNESTVRIQLDKTEDTIQPDDDFLTEQSKKSVSEKLIFGEFQKVKLTENEYQKLIERIGEKNTLIMISQLDSYLASKNKKYASHYATILVWVRKRIEEQKSHDGANLAKSKYQVDGL